jgi:predicted metalloprotease
MKVEGRRESSNIKDNRGGVSKKAAAAGGGGVAVIALLIYFLTGQNVAPQLAQQQAQPQQCAGAECQLEAQAADSNTKGYAYQTGEFKNEGELKKFVSVILASTEDVWHQVFKTNSLQYHEPSLTLFSDAVDTGCGHADYNAGPFYCSADKSVYIDLNFLADMTKTLGAGGDFAYAYVIAHEVGHHVQNELGYLVKYGSQEQMLRKSGKETEANLISVQTELQADCFAGVWAYHEGKKYKSISDADIEKGIKAAAAVGDDKLGVKRRENFGHGSSQMRMKWLKRGLTSGDINKCDTRQYTLDQLQNI